MRLVRLMPILLMLGWSFLACHRSQQKPSVILISLDTVRADHLSLYGYFRKTTPFLEELGKESVVFTNARSQIPITVPSHATIFSSHYPSELKLVDNGWRLENWDRPLLAEVLEREGYQTAAVLASSILERYHGLDRGFQSYQDQDLKPKVPVVRSEEDQKRTKKKRLAQDVVDRGIEWLSQLKPGQPFFLFLHFYDGHRPYFFPQDWKKPFSNDAELAQYLESRAYLIKDDYDQVNDYDNSISYLDQNLERFFRYLKETNLLDNAIVVVVADHGEGLGQHNYYRHGLHLYEEQMRVPLLIRFPRAEHGGIRPEAQVGLIDVAPTVLDFLEIKDRMKSRGGSLLPLGASQKSGVRTCDFLERGWSPEEKPAGGKNWTAVKKAGAVCGEWKLIWSDRDPVELYDLGPDPLELKNLKEAEPKKSAELSATLQDHLKEIDFNSVKPQAVPKNVQKTLKSLGYAQ